MLSAWATQNLVQYDEICPISASVVGNARHLSDNIGTTQFGRTSIGQYWNDAIDSNDSVYNFLYLTINYHYKYNEINKKVNIHFIEKYILGIFPHNSSF